MLPRATSATSLRAGFTLIELLVVIAIIGLLASIVLASLTSARQKGRDARRLADLKEIRTAMELYASDHNGEYPKAPAGNWHWATECSGWQGPTADYLKSALVPAYMPSFPTDPAMNAASNLNCYLYVSDGTNFKLMDYHSDANLQSQANMMDPKNPNSPFASKCATWDANRGWALWTAGAACW